MSNISSVHESTIYTEDRTGEFFTWIDIYHILTPQAIDQVNRATALIEEKENQDNELNSINDEMDKEQTGHDFIAF